MAVVLDDLRISTDGRHDDGRRQAIASSSVNDAASLIDVRAKTSEARNTSGTSFRTPRNRTREPMPRSAACAGERLAQRAVAGKQKFGVGERRRDTCKRAQQHGVVLDGVKAGDARDELLSSRQSEPLPRPRP